MGWRTAADARDYSRATGSAYTVLVMLAERAPDETRVAHPGLKLLAHDARTTRSTVQRGLTTLEELGEIAAVAHRAGGRGKATEWRVLVGPDLYATTYAESKESQSDTPAERVSSEPERVSSDALKGGTGATPTNTTKETTNSLGAQDALATGDVPQDILDAAELVTATAKTRGFPADQMPRVAVEVITACLAAPGRAYRTEGERFREWWTTGKGQRKPLSSPVAAWRNWLKTAPDASAYERPARSHRPRRGPSPDEMRAAAAELRAKGR